MYEYSMYEYSMFSNIVPWKLFTVSKMASITNDLHNKAYINIKNVFI